MNTNDDQIPDTGTLQVVKHPDAGEQIHALAFQRRFPNRGRRADSRSKCQRDAWTFSTHYALCRARLESTFKVKAKIKGKAEAKGAFDCVYNALWQLQRVVFSHNNFQTYPISPFRVT